MYGGTLHIQLKTDTVGRLYFGLDGEEMGVEPLIPLTISSVLACLYASSKFPVEHFLSSLLSMTTAGGGAIPGGGRC